MSNERLIEVGPLELRFLTGLVKSPQAVSAISEARHPFHLDRDTLNYPRREQ